MTMTVGDNRKNIKRLRELEDGWDGQGAAVPSPEALSFLEEIADVLDRHDMWACPAPNGEVCVENDAGLMFDIGFFPDE